ncbi:MAG: cardiolipin synthase [Lachnospiraceae bacterium]|nr:cardiolipin synthase [Lachnospiraceae bacterium]
MARLIKMLSSRLMVWAILMLAQVGWFVSLVLYFNKTFPFAGVLVQIAAVLIVLIIVNKETNPSFKLAWSVLILGIPILGITMYYLFGRTEITKTNRRRIAIMHEKSVKFLSDNEDVMGRISARSRGAGKQSDYIRKWSDFPPYDNYGLTYYMSGDDTLKPILDAIDGAKEYIFLEFFIIEEGVFLNSILKALQKKALEGIEVRMMYDDFGSATKVPLYYDKVIEGMGIQCIRFNPLRPFLSVVMNNRDHRKMIIVDGKIAFTGGFNLADEYINQQERFGYWKDNGLRIEGPAVSNFVAMFMEMWQYSTREKEDESPYFATFKEGEFVKQPGYIQPYADSPLDREKVGETVYLNIINRAKDYIYIFTPYLIIDNEMMTALCNAAKQGVDVRIVTPGIPDKKLVFLMTQSYYVTLLEAGVRIYEFRPGFIHAKTFVCDDVIATVGTINLDYRSLYMHFECGVWIHRANEISQIKEDALNTFSISEEITYEKEINRNWLIKTIQGVLRLLAPIF